MSHHEAETYNNSMCTTVGYIAVADEHGDRRAIASSQLAKGPSRQMLHSSCVIVQQIWQNLDLDMG